MTNLIKEVRQAKARIDEINAKNHEQGWLDYTEAKERQRLREDIKQKERFAGALLTGDTNKRFIV